MAFLQIPPPACLCLEEESQPEKENLLILLHKVSTAVFTHRRTWKWTEQSQRLSTKRIFNLYKMQTMVS